VSERDGLDQQVETFAGEQFCYLTTRGRVSGQPHTIEIWFATSAGRVYLLSELGEQADWVKNLRQEPEVTLRLGSLAFRAQAHVASPGDEALLARRLIAAKYEGWREGESLSDWAQTATPIVLEIAALTESA